MPQQLDLYSKITTKHNILPKGRNNVSSKTSSYSDQKPDDSQMLEGWKGHYRSTKKSLKSLHLTLPLGLLAATEHEYLFLSILQLEKGKERKKKVLASIGLLIGCRISQKDCTMGCSSTYPCQWQLPEQLWEKQSQSKLTTPVKELATHQLCGFE